MTRPDDAAKVPKTESEKPESGRKHLDPTRYQVATFSPELRSEFQRLPLHRYSEDELKPPPGYGGTPAVEPAAVADLAADPGKQSLPLLGGRRLMVAACVLLVAVLGLVAAWRYSASTPSPNGEIQPTITVTQPVTQVVSAPKELSIPTAPVSSPRMTSSAASASTIRPTEPGAKVPTKKTKPPVTSEVSKPPPERVINVPILDR